MLGNEFCSCMETARNKILIVDDEPGIVDFVSYNFEKEGFDVVTASNGEEAIETAKNENPTLILLDVMMPKMDGIQVCQELRRLPEFKSTLIALLSARSEDYSQIAGFESGADDYISKPIRPRLLVARIKALLKRSTLMEEEPSIVILGCVSVDTEKRLVYKGDESLELPKKEYDLLMLLGSKMGKVFSREQIYQKLCGNDLYVGDRTIDVHIRKLREKIGESCIKTLKGVGYKFNEDCV